MRDTIWVVRDPSGKVIGASVDLPWGAFEQADFLNENAAVESIRQRVLEGDAPGLRYEYDGYTLTREALAAPSAAAGREEVCTGCDSHRIAAIRSVIAGRIACCPDCSTLTMGERNSIREAVKDRLAAEDKAEAGREVTEALDRIEAALDELPSREIDEFNPELGMICTESWTMLPSVYRIIRDERALAAERGREG